MWLHVWTANLGFSSALMMVPPENSVQPIAEALSSKRIEDSTGLWLCLSLMNEIRPCARRERQFGRKFQRSQGDAARSAMGFCFFRQPAVRSGGAAHRLPGPTQPNPFLAAESLVALVSPSPTKDAF